MWKLAIEDDQGNKTDVNLARSEYTVGRGEDNTIRLTERNISRRHAAIRQNGVGWTIQDLDSYNGCFVNGVRVAEPQGLTHGDLVQLGDYRLVITDEEASVTREKSATLPSVPRSQSLLDQPDRLVMIAGPTPGAEYPLALERLVIGRGEECDIPINHGSVSRVHSEIVALGDGRYEIIDKESANGVRVNGVELKRSLLDARDLIELGDVRLKFIPAGVIYRLADESQQLPAYAAERVSGPHGVAPSALDQIPTAVKVIGGVVILGLLVILGMVIFGGTGSDTTDETIAATGADKANQVLERAQLLIRKGDYEGAHRLVTTEIPEDSNARKSSEFRDIEGKWADHILAQADQTSDLSKKRELLDRVAKTTTVDSGRRNLANDKLLDLDADGVDIDELPPDHPRRFRGPGANPAPGAKAGKPGIVRDNPFDEPGAGGPAGISEDQRRDMTAVKNQLLGKASSGAASIHELRTLASICAKLGDVACRAKAAALIAKKQAEN